MSKRVIILGTAHGSNVSGKRSPDGSHYEWRWSRAMCKRVKAMLNERGIDAVIDIEGDKETSLNARVRLVNQLVKELGGASRTAYVSIHNNAAASDAKWHTASGSGVYVSPNASSNSKALATEIHERNLVYGLEGNRSYPKAGYYVQNLAVCRDTSCPAVLVECLFQDNKSDLAILMSEDGQQRIATAIVDGIVEWLG